jgi:hypothetical protein
MLKKLATVRGLKPKKAIPGVELDRKALIGKIKDKVAREIPPEEIRREGDLLKIYGFIPTSLDYLDETMKLLEAQLAGFYEPGDGTMYIAGDMDEMNSTATLAHELVHGLQDQYYDLKSRSDFKPGESDKSTALSCLAEGDATSVMTDVILKRMHMSALDQDDDDYDEQMRASMNTGPSKRIPKVMRTSLVAPYIEGIKFVHAQRRAGGGNFSQVDAAWRDIPTTTEQILHPEKWRAREPALAVSTPTSAALPGFTLDAQDTDGELGLRVAYEEWLTRSEAASIAADWGGDRSALFIKGDELAAVTHVRYDAPAVPRATRAFAAITAGLADKVGKPAVKKADFVCIERPALGPLALRVAGGDLVLSAGPAKKMQDTWKSTANCALAESWTREVAAGK